LQARIARHNGGQWTAAHERLAMLHSTTAFWYVAPGSDLGWLDINRAPSVLTALRNVRLSRRQRGWLRHLLLQPAMPSCRLVCCWLCSWRLGTSGHYRRHTVTGGHVIGCNGCNGVLMKQHSTCERWCQGWSAACANNISRVHSS
jgi:hypothetical protein